MGKPQTEVERLEWALRYYQDRLAEQPGDGMFTDYILTTCKQLDAARAKEKP